MDEKWHQHGIMVVIVGELHNNWKGIIARELQLSCNELHHIYGELQVSDATQKLSCKASCKAPFFFIVKSILRGYHVDFKIWHLSNSKMFWNLTTQV
jgi:hypothetical protein